MTIFHRVNIHRIFKTASLISLAGLMSGCLLTSPHWNQVFASHTDSVPLQAWTTDKDVAITFECSQAYHGGLYPPFSPPSWTHIANVMPEQIGSLDSNGARIHSSSRAGALPNSCWRYDSANGNWYAAVRARQGTNEYRTFDLTGLECLGRENGKDGSWFGWLGHGCEKTYFNSTTVIPFAIIRAES